MGRTYSTILMVKFINPLTMFMTSYTAKNCFITIMVKSIQRKTISTVLSTANSFIMTKMGMSSINFPFVAILEKENSNSKKHYFCSPKQRR